MTTRELIDILETFDSQGHKDCEVKIEDEYGFSMDIGNVIIFDGDIVIRRESVL